jgi:hypothetical protein
MSMTRREQLRQGLLRLTDVMLQGSLSQTTRTCGRPNCRCHRGERHGPHTYLTFKTADGRSSALYVPPSELATFRKAVAAWARFWCIGVRLAEVNRQQVVRNRRTRGRSDARPA